MSAPPQDFAYAKALYKATSLTKNWPYEPVGSATHQLIACQSACSVNGRSLVDVWLDGGLSQASLKLHHRGEVLATLVRIGIRLANLELSLHTLFNTR